MDVKRNLLYVPSLENLTAIKVAVCLWKTDLNDTKQDVGLRKLGQVRQARKAGELGLTETVKSKIHILIKQIWIEVDTWIRFHEIYTKMNRINWDNYNVLNNIVWTNVGTINTVDTAASLIRDPSVLTVLEKFNLACTHCLLNPIHELISEFIGTESTGDIVPDSSPLTFFFACVATGDMHKLNRFPNIVTYDGDGDYSDLTVNEIDFSTVPPNWHLEAKLRPNSSNGNVEMTVDCDNANYLLMLRDMLNTREIFDNENAFMFFWKLLPKEHRYGPYFRNGGEGHPRALLLHMDEEEQRDYLAEYSLYVFRECLRKPLEVKYILNMMNQVTNNLPAVDLYGMLHEILQRLCYFQSTPAYHSYLFVLDQLFQRIPRDKRLQIISLNGAPDFVYLVMFAGELIIDAHSYAIKLLLKDADVHLQKKVFNSKYGKRFCMEAVVANRSNVLEKLLGPAELTLFDISFENWQLSELNKYMIKQIEDIVAKLKSCSEGVSRDDLWHGFSEWIKLLEGINEVLRPSNQSVHQINVIKSVMKKFWESINLIALQLTQLPPN